MNEAIKGSQKSSVRRILLGKAQSQSVSDMVKRLRSNSCKTDSSKVVNEIVRLFFQKYVSTDYDILAAAFFDKKSYLKDLINKASEEEIDESIKKYLSKNGPQKRPGRKSKPSLNPVNVDEAPSS